MLLKVPEEKIVYSKEPENSMEYTKKLDAEYSKYTKLYDAAVKLLPVWKTWIKTVIPHIKAKKTLSTDLFLRCGCKINWLCEALYDIIQDTLISPVAIGYMYAGRYFFTKSFITSSDCDKCRICEKTCPVNAIKQVDGRMFWT